MNNKKLGIDILNDHELMNVLKEDGIKNIKIYRRRQNYYYKHNYEYKLIELGNDNDVIASSFQYNNVQDIEILIIGIKDNGNKVLINKYDYSNENKKKGLDLKEYLLKQKENA